MTFTAADLAKCAEREVGQRRGVYPRLIGTGRLTQEKADREIQMMAEIARRLREQADAELNAGRLL